MADLRQILSQGRKRIGLLVGAGAPVSVRVNTEGKLDPEGTPLIPDVARLTQVVEENLEDADKTTVERIKAELHGAPNIEMILTRVRRLAQAIGGAEVYGRTGAGFEQLAERICQKIGEVVAPVLPQGTNPYTELVAWVGGTQRQYPVEIFTPNYDLLFEEAFERSRLPYFDGFSGAHRPFFDPSSIAGDHLPSRWSRLWKIHGSLGWVADGESIVRTGSRGATSLIYPDHLKYDQVTRQPYSALFDRLRTFLTTPDTLLICTGFSFGDAHISAVIDESLASNSHTAVLAFQFGDIDDSSPAVQLAMTRPNLSIYGRDGAVIYGIKGRWMPGVPQNEDWESIQKTFWRYSEDGGEFLLGDYAKLARFCALAQATACEQSDDASDMCEVDGEVHGEGGAEETGAIDA